MSKNNEQRQELLGERNQENAENVAHALLWAMNDMLPWYTKHPRAGMHLVRSHNEL